MKVVDVMVRTRHWPKQDVHTCQVIALPEIPDGEIAAGQQVAYGTGPTAEAATADAIGILRDTLALIDRGRR